MGAGLAAQQVADNHNAPNPQMLKASSPLMIWFNRNRHTGIFLLNIVWSRSHELDIVTDIQ